MHPYISYYTEPFGISRPKGDMIERFSQDVFRPSFTKSINITILFSDSVQHIWMEAIMIDPCHKLRETVMRLGRKLDQSSLHNIWPRKSFLTREDIHKLKEAIDQMGGIEQEFKEAVFELADCVKKYDAE